MSQHTIKSLNACEILDSRGRPTLEVQLTTSGGITASAQVPSGASTGKSEAHELRDGEAHRYAGLGVQTACRYVAGELFAAVQGLAVTNQAEIDQALISADGTPNKQRLGANAILGISCAAARAAALSVRQPLWQYLAGPRTVRIPLPMVNILSGGLHASQGMEFQDFLALPHAAGSFRQAMEWVCRIHTEARSLLSQRNITLTGVADEGGWGPRLASNEEALEILTAAIETSGLTPGAQVSIALDVASSHFFRDGQYVLGSEGRTLTATDFIAHLQHLVECYPVASIEDGLEQEDWAHWPALTAALGERCQIVGDDFLTTNSARVTRAIQERAANAVLVKMNQIGTLTETFAVIDQARAAGWRAVISARSGETEDSFLADLAIASGMAQIKVGSITRSERLAKYNRLLVLEAQGGLPHWSSAPSLLPTARA